MGIYLMPGLELVPSHAPHLTLQRTTWVSNDILSRIRKQRTREIHQFAHQDHGISTV